MLADLNGKPLIKYVFDKCVETGLPTYVVTPDEAIANVIGKENSLLPDSESRQLQLETNFRKINDRKLR